MQSLTLHRNSSARRVISVTWPNIRRKNMSTARLNVWITQQGDPCRIENKKTLFVHVLHCNGEPLEWCGRKYLHIPARCGHLDIEIPPGCYIVGAVENPQGIPPLGNHLTHVAIVRA